MPIRSRRCAHCDGKIPAQASYCQRCGTASDHDDTSIFDPAINDDGVIESGPDRGRLALVIGGLVAVGLAVSVVAAFRVSEPTGTAYEDPAPSSVPTTATTSPTTPASSTTSSTPAGPLLVTGRAGPVLGDGTEGTLVGIAGPAIYWVDLATGVLTDARLGNSADDTTGPFGPVVMDNQLISVHLERDLLLTDLRTGAQQSTEIDYQWAPPVGFGGRHVPGPASHDSVWVIDNSFNNSATAIEVDLDGRTHQQIELPAPFQIRATDGPYLYLDGPGATVRIDTTNGTRQQLNGRITGGSHQPLVVVACDTTLSCSVYLEQHGQQSPTSRC
ncbi:MAG: hypothetical protein GY701_23815 [Sulfitobacter sp.]|nr:hypothetical protein [Sulfitobacter sp.]MCP3910564.1 hypothetical protein [Actinomycetes bacterium]